MKSIATRIVRLGLSIVIAVQVIWIASTAVGAESATEAPTTQTAAPTVLDMMLAERFAQLSDTLVNTATDPTHIRQAAVLSAIAHQLNPQDSRLARASAALFMQTGNIDAAVKTLEQLRVLTPDDELVAVHYIDLILYQMETAERKLQYIERVVKTKQVAEAVRSHVAVQAYDLLLDRAEDARASEMLDLALKLNPQNITALRLKLQRISVDGGDQIARLKALTDLLMAAPSDPQALVAVAQIQARAGLYGEAALMYNVALVSAEQRGTTPPIEDRLDHMSSIILAGGAGVAANYLEGAYRQGTLLDPELLMLRAMAIQELGAGVPDDLRTSSVEQARRAQIGRVAYISRMIRNPSANEPLPTTLPTDTLPDVVEDALALMKDGNPDLRAAYTGSIKALLEFEMVVGNPGQPIPEMNLLVKALKILVGETDPLYARFEGMRLLQAGLIDEARPKLEAAGETDRFARAELLKISQATSKPTGLQELFEQQPDGLDAAMFFHHYRDNNVKPAELPLAKEVGPITEPVTAFVNKCFSEPRKIYSVRARPVVVSHDFGQPMFAEVTITNISPEPVVIGNGGLIAPTIAFDASVRGVQQKLPRVASMKITGRIRLAPRDSIKQIVRLDGGMLASLLRQIPTFSLGITVLGYTNPLIAPGKTETISGIGGFPIQVGSIIERRPTQIENPKLREALGQALTSGPPEQRLVIYELLSSVLPQLARSDKPNVQEIYNNYRSMVMDAMKGETIPGLRGFAIALQAVINADVDKVADYVSAMLDQPNELDQALAIVLANDLDKEKRKLFATRIKNEAASPLIAEMADALAEMPDRPTTQPTTQPANP